MPNWCQHCLWWSFTYQDAEKKFGTCENDSFIDSVRIVQEDAISDKTVFTEACFGCVWFEGKEKIVAEIKPDI